MITSRTHCNSALAAPARACGFQAYCHCISSAVWAWFMSPTFPAVADFVHRHHTNFTSLFLTINCRSLVVSSCYSHHMELSPCGCTIIPVFINLPSAFKDIFFFSANPFPIYYYSTAFSLFLYAFVDSDIVAIAH